MSRLALLVVAVSTVSLASCGHSSADLRTARRATYDAPFATIWNVVTDEIRKKFPQVEFEDPVKGTILTAWIRVENRDSSQMDPTTGNTATGAQTGSSSQLFGVGNSIIPATLFRMNVAVKGPPWRVMVDGEAADYRPGLQPPIILIKHGQADEPPWVQNRIDSMVMEVHDRLKQHAVKTSAVPKDSLATRTFDDAPWSKLTDPDAVALISTVHDAAANKNTGALRPTMIEDFRWGLGADGSAETALVLWSADPTKLRELARAIETGCASEEATGEVVCPAAGLGKGSMARFRKVGSAWKFVLFFAR